MVGATEEVTWLSELKVSSSVLLKLNREGNTRKSIERSREQTLYIAEMKKTGWEWPTTSSCVLPVFTLYPPSFSDVPV